MARQPTRMHIYYMSGPHIRLCRNVVLLLALLATSLSVPAAQAVVDPADVPTPLAKALEIYKKDGVSRFIDTLVSGGPLEGNREIGMQMRVLEKIEKYYGDYQSYDVLQIRRLSASTRLVYFMLNYRKGPVFGTLTAYNTGERETVTSFRFHTKAEKIFPEALLVNR